MVSTSSGKITPAKATKSLAFCYHMQVKPTPTSTFAQTDT
jgi:hypothetical protein